MRTTIVCKGRLLTVKTLIVPQPARCISSVFSCDTFLSFCSRCSIVFNSFRDQKKTFSIFITTKQYFHNFFNP